MATHFAREIRDLVASYLAGTIPLHQLEDEVLPILWDDGDHSPEALELAGNMHIALAEMSRGDRSLESMRLELANAIRPSDVASQESLIRSLV